MNYKNTANINLHKWILIEKPTLSARSRSLMKKLIKFSL